MKCQLLIADGNRQVILYPEDEDEKRILECIVDPKYDVKTQMTDTEIRMTAGGCYRNQILRGVSNFSDPEQIVITMTPKRSEESNASGD